MNIKDDKRPQRYGWAPGGYLQTCRTCNEHYSGDKRATLCADCAYALPDPTPNPLHTSLNLGSEIDQLRAQLAKAISALRGNKRGIYTASKVKHAAIWRHYRDQGFPIISTWIDEAEEGESSSYEELSVRCIEEAKSAQILMLFCEDEEILKGALIEAGAALASNVQIACIGDCPSLSRVFKEHPLWKEYASPAAFFYAHRHLIASTTLAELKGE
jgi:hypothetical protein